MTISEAPLKISYPEYRDQWLVDIEAPGLSSLAKGRRFATKLITQWLGVTTDDDDFVVCDGSGDGGIDVAYLHRANADTPDMVSESNDGDTWYIFQSKYGSAYTGIDTIRAEGDKVIRTLRGVNPSIAADTQQLLAKLDLFRQNASEHDRIVLVFATVDPIPASDRPTFDDIKLLGRQHITPTFDVEEVSVMTIWEALREADPSRLSVPLQGQFVEQYAGLLVGTVSLIDLFAFLNDYKGHTGDLNQLYQKNVRQFLGGRRKVNKGIAATLNDQPEKFGLYNNGITIVVSRYTKSQTDDTIVVYDPYIVNGCQTTRTIWSVLDSKLNAGGTGTASSDGWRARVERGGVVTKIVSSDQAEITHITRYTNSQNSVREQDFIALESGFQDWAAGMAIGHRIFLEIQRGGIEARKAWEKQHPEEQQFEDYVNAFDLIKVYGSGWLSEPGQAFAKNGPFLPKGAIYQRIMTRPPSEAPYGIRDMYAAYKVKCAADDIGFGRNTQASRRQSRFLFYFVLLRMLSNVVLLTPQFRDPPVTETDLTDAVLKLASGNAVDELRVLRDAAVNLVDQYLTVGSQTSAHMESSFVDVHNGDLNAFLKADNLGTDNHSPLLTTALAIQNAAFEMSGGRARVASALLRA